MEQIYRLKINVGRVSFELESHDKEWLEKKEKELMGALLSDSRTLEQSGGGGDPDAILASRQLTDTGLTINEFYRKYTSGKSLPVTTIALVLIYYLEKVRGVEQISTNEVKSAFKEIAYPKIDKINFTDKCNLLKGKGFLNKVENRWKLTITGIDFILNTLSAE